MRKLKGSKKAREEARETAETTPRLRLKDFSTLAKDFSPTMDEIIVIIEEEDSNKERAEETRDLQKFRREVFAFLEELYRKSNLPDVESLLRWLNLLR